MRVMFVCTGNICRSPMGELLLSRYLTGSSVQVSSAGTRGLPHHAIDPSSARLMKSVGIDASKFRSRRLTRAMAESADLILCFEKSQRKDIVTLAPSVVRRVFLLNEYADIAQYCAQNGLIRGLTVAERLQSVIEAAPMVRPMIAEPADIADPHGKDFGCFRLAAEQTNHALHMILVAIRKYYDARRAPFRHRITQRDLTFSV